MILIIDKTELRNNNTLMAKMNQPTLPERIAHAWWQLVCQAHVVKSFSVISCARTSSVKQTPTHTANGQETDVRGNVITRNPTSM